VCIVSSIAVYLGDQSLNLLQQPLENFAVRNVRCGHFYPNNIPQIGIHGEMNLAPGAAFAHSMLANFPFPLAKYLQACRIDHYMQRFSVGSAWYRLTRRYCIGRMACAISVIFEILKQIKLKSIKNQFYRYLNKLFKMQTMKNSANEK
jgi:hypothetical protein